MFYEEKGTVFNIYSQRADNKQSERGQTEPSELFCSAHTCVLLCQEILFRSFLLRAWDYEEKTKDVLLLLRIWEHFSLGLQAAIMRSVNQLVMRKGNRTGAVRDGGGEPPLVPLTAEPSPRVALGQQEQSWQSRGVM